MCPTFTNFAHPVGLSGQEPHMASDAIAEKHENHSNARAQHWGEKKQMDSWGLLAVQPSLPLKFQASERDP